VVTGALSAPWVAMNSRLSRIKDWPVRTARAGFRISALAADCRVSEQHLRRYIRSEFGHPPHVWMMSQRLCQAPKLLEQGLMVKEVSDRLLFKNTEHFSRAFKRYYRVSPSSFRPAIAGN
jgi:AraC-like DNA-binding protein